MVTVLAGCSKDKEAGDNTTSPSASLAASPTVSPSESTAASSTPSAKPIEITWHGNFQNEISENSTIEQQIEKQFNVTLNYINAKNDKLPLLAASNNMPDVMKLPDPKDVTEYAKAGLLLELPVDTLKTEIPDVFNAINQVNTNLWGLTKYNEKNYAIPQYVVYISWDSAMKWRKDILDQAGIAQTPTTIAEYDTAFKAISDKKKDIIKATNPALKDLYMFSGTDISLSWNQFTWAFGAYGTMPGTWQVNDQGTVVRGEVAPSTKDALAKLHEWYKAGYLDPAFVTDKGDQYNAKWEKGEYAINAYGFIGDAVPVKAGAAPIPSDVNLTKSVPTAVSVWEKAPIGPTGKQGFFSWGPRQNFVAISSRLKDQPEKLAKVYEMLNTIAANDQLWLNTTYGIEGTSYKLADGLPQFIPPYDDIKTDEAKKLGVIGNGSPFAPFASLDVTKKYTDPSLASTWEKLQTDVSDVLFGLPLPSSAEFEQRNQEKWSATMVKVIIGEQPISAFDDYVKWFNDNGGKKWTEEANDLYTKQFKK
ncbi:unnamed protein product [Aphanomyces euteiches]